MSLVSPIPVNPTSNTQPATNYHHYHPFKKMMSEAKNQPGVRLVPNTTESFIDNNQHNQHTTTTISVIKTGTISETQTQLSPAARTSPVRSGHLDTNTTNHQVHSPQSALSSTVNTLESERRNELKRIILCSPSSEPSITSLSEATDGVITSPLKRARVDPTEPAMSAAVANGLPCPCGKQFLDSAMFIDHARQCDEFALTATSFAEAAAAVASATNGTKLSSFSSSSSSSSASSSSSGRLVTMSSPKSGISITGAVNGIHAVEINSPTVRASDPNESMIRECETETPVTAAGVIGAGHTALDLSVRSQTASSPEPTIYNCTECKYTQSNLSYLLHHFETQHADRGRFDCCWCGETYTWFPNLLKHRLHCESSQVRTTLASSALPSPVSAGCSAPTPTLTTIATSSSSPVLLTSSRSPSRTRVGSESISRNGVHDWPPGAYAVPVPKTLQCTGCGKTGFANPTEVLNHFQHCPILQHRARSPGMQTGHAVGSSYFRPNLTGCGPFAQWSYSPLYGGSIPPPPPSTALGRSELGYSPPGFPPGFMPPLGCYPPYSKSYNQKVNTPSFPITKPAHKTILKSNGSEKDSNLNVNNHMHANQALSITTSSSSTTMTGADVQSAPDLTRPFKCCHCIKAFKSKALLDQHMHIHYPPKYTCRYCAKKYRWPPVFYHHQRTCKKRPPSTTTSTSTGSGAPLDTCPMTTVTTTSSHTFNPRSIGSNCLGGTDPLLYPLTSGYLFPPTEFVTNQTQNHCNPMQNNNSISQHASNRFPTALPFVPPNSTMHGHPFGSDLFSASLAAFYDPALSVTTSNPAGSVTPGPVPNPSAMLAAAAACAAMGMRVPFGNSLPPPPLGFNPLYSTASSNPLPFVSPCAPPALFPPVPPTSAHHTHAPVPASTTSTTTTTTTGMFSPLHPFPNPTMFFMTGIDSTGSSSPSSTVSFAPNGSKPPSDYLVTDSHRTLLCVCGQQFDQLPVYLTHLAGCSILQRLVQPTSKSDEPHMVPFQFIPDASDVVTTNSEPSPVTSTARLGVVSSSDSEPVLFSSAAMAAMNAIISRVHPDENNKLDTTAPGQKHTETGWTSLESSRFSEHSSKPEQISPEERRQSEDKMNQETTKHPWDVPNRTTSITFISSNENETSVLTKTDPEKENPTASTSTTNSTSAVTTMTTQTSTTTSLMAAMATVLANAAAAVGFHCPGLPEDMSPTLPSLVHSPTAEFDSNALLNGSMQSKLCTQCGKEFSSRLSLKQHVEGKHSAEGKYQCPGCAKRYRWGASYYYHKKSCPAIRDPSPLSASDLFLDSCEGGAGTPTLRSPHHEVSEEPDDEYDDAEVDPDRNVATGGSTNQFCNPDDERTRERTNEYEFDGDRDFIGSVSRFRPMQHPLDMRHGRLMKTEDQYTYSPSNEAPTAN